MCLITEVLACAAGILTDTEPHEPLLHAANVWHLGMTPAQFWSVSQSLSLASSHGAPYAAA